MHTIPAYTSQTIEDFFPKQCVHHLVAIEGTFEDKLFDEEKLVIAKTTSKKRKQEFSAGRHAAHCAIEKLDKAAIAITRGTFGEPLFPEGIIGSISHSRTLSIAVVAFSSQISLLGVDIEHVKEISPAIMKHIATPEESDLFGPTPDTRDLLALFSAKESLYKMLAPHVQERFWYHDAEVVDFSEGELTLRLLRSLHKDFQKGWSTKIRLAELEDSIVSYGAS